MVRVLVSSESIKVVTVATGMGSLAALEPRSLHSAPFIWEEGRGKLGLPF